MVRMDTTHSVLLSNFLLQDTCGILENCHDGDLCTIDTAQYENNEWICKFKEIVCGDRHWCDGLDGMCKDLQTKLTASDVTYQWGRSIAISGDVLVVGGYIEAAVYIFEKNDDNSWAQTTKLTPDDGAVEDASEYNRFGRDGVDIFGDTIIVGASGDSNYTGAAYIYSRQYGENWTQAAIINASDGADGDEFGRTVSASEDLVAVGTDTSSAVYIFEKDGVSGIWEETATLLTGLVRLSSLSVSGDVLAVGSGSRYSNSVIVYERNETDGSWARTMNLTSPIGSTRDGFGYSVSVDGAILVVGAYYSDGNKGVAYVYEKNQTNWELTAKLTANDGTQDSFFGQSVGVSDGIIVVGVPGDFSKRGSVYTFQKHAGNWTQMNKITADDRKSNDFFGWSVDINGDIVAVGAINDDGGKGSVYLNKLLS
jgi:hypothetical protein